jgi:hypothetical protein
MHTHEELVDSPCRGLDKSFSGGILAKLLQECLDSSLRLGVAFCTPHVSPLVLAFNLYFMLNKCKLSSQMSKDSTRKALKTTSKGVSDDRSLQKPADSPGVPISLMNLCDMAEMLGLCEPKIAAHDGRARRLPTAWLAMRLMLVLIMGSLKRSADFWDLRAAPLRNVCHVVALTIIFDHSDGQKERGFFLRPKSAVASVVQCSYRRQQNVC